MSDFQLDVDSPYTQPSRQDLDIRPAKLPYPQSRITFKHYGKYTQKFVRRLVEETPRHNIDDQLLNVARYMRTKSFEFNNEHPNNDAIARDIRIMSASNIELNLAEVLNLRCNYCSNQPSQRNVKGKKLQHAPQRKMQKGGQKNTARHNSHK